jgi:hypothetical protein
LFGTTYLTQSVTYHSIRRNEMVRFWSGGDVTNCKILNICGSEKYLSSDLARMDDPFVVVAAVVEGICGLLKPNRHIRLCADQNDSRGKNTVNLI